MHSPANRMPVRYREVAVTTVDFPLTAAALRRHFEGREAYRRTGYVVVHGPDQEVALLEVEKSSVEELFAPITRVTVLAGPDEAAFVHAPEVDLGVPGQVCRAALTRAPDTRCVIIQGRYEHVSFILDPDPIRVSSGSGDDLICLRFETMKVYSALGAVRHLLETGQVRPGDTLRMKLTVLEAHRQRLFAVLPVVRLHPGARGLGLDGSEVRDLAAALVATAC